MEFLLFLTSECIECYALLGRIKSIHFTNLTIKQEFLNIILSLCSLSKFDYFKNKYIIFNSCIIPKEIKLGYLPCKDAAMMFDCCTIEDFQSLNGFYGELLDISRSTIQQYTGSVTINCSDVTLDYISMNYPYFFLNTIINNLKKLEIWREEYFDEHELFFITFFNELCELTIPAILEDTYCLDRLRNLELVRGVRKKDPVSQKVKEYFGTKHIIFSSKYPNIYVEDEEFSLWYRRINDKSLDDNDIREHLKMDRYDRFKPIREAYEAQRGKKELFDFKFLSDIGALRVIETGLPFGDWKDDSITCYILDGFYIPRCKKSGVQYNEGVISLTRYIDNESIFISIEDKKLKIIDTNERGNFTLEGSILGNDVEQVRKTISFLQYQKKIYNSPSNKIKRLKRMIDGINSSING